MTNMEPTFSIVADEERRSTFLRHLNRPTFQRSGLSEHLPSYEVRGGFFLA